MAKAESYRTPRQEQILRYLVSVGGEVRDPEGMAGRIVLDAAGTPRRGDGRTASTSLKDLADKGWITREVRGKRCFRITITDAGREAVAESEWVPPYQRIGQQQPYQPGTTAATPATTDEPVVQVFRLPTVAERAPVSSYQNPTPARSVETPERYAPTIEDADVNTLVRVLTEKLLAENGWVQAQEVTERVTALEAQCQEANRLLRQAHDDLLLERERSAILERNLAIYQGSRTRSGTPLRDLLSEDSRRELDKLMRELPEHPRRG